MDSVSYLGLSLVVLTLSSLMFLRKRFWSKERDSIRLVWVIGASSGIGKEVAIKYAQEGKSVILSSRSKEKLQEVQCDICKSTGKDVSCYPILLLDIEQDEVFGSKMKQAASLFGTPDVVVICSGLGIRALNSETTAEVEKRMLQTNYTGPILLAKEVLLLMRQRHSGAIVFVSSIQGILSVPGRSSYSGAKHALQGYCDCIRAEEAVNGIHIMTVSPAYVKTNHSLNSIRGDGSSYSMMDKTTSKGMDASDLASLIIDGILSRKGNMIIAPVYMKLVIVLQAMFPSLVDMIMKRKAIKNRND